MVEKAPTLTVVDVRAFAERLKLTIRGFLSLQRSGMLPVPLNADAAAKSYVWQLAVVDAFVNGTYNGPRLEPAEKGPTKDEPKGTRDMHVIAITWKDLAKINELSSEIRNIAWKLISDKDKPKS